MGLLGGVGVLVVYLQIRERSARWTVMSTSDSDVRDAKSENAMAFLESYWSMLDALEGFTPMRLVILTLVLCAVASAVLSVSVRRGGFALWLALSFVLSVVVGAALCFFVLFRN